MFVLPNVVHLKSLDLCRVTFPRRRFCWLLFPVKIKKISQLMIIISHVWPVKYFNLLFCFRLLLSFPTNKLFKRSRRYFGTLIHWWETCGGHFLKKGGPSKRPLGLFVKLVVKITEEKMLACGQLTMEWANGMGCAAHVCCTSTTVCLQCVTKFLTGQKSSDWRNLTKCNVSRRVYKLIFLIASDWDFSFWIGC